MQLTVFFVSPFCACYRIQIYRLEEDLFEETAIKDKIVFCILILVLFSDVRSQYLAGFICDRFNKLCVEFAAELVVIKTNFLVKLLTK